MLYLASLASNQTEVNMNITVTDYEGYPQSMIDKAVESMTSTLAFAGIDFSGMTGDEMQAAARTLSAPCDHKFEAHISEVDGRKCKKCSRCGGIQN